MVPWLMLALPSTTLASNTTLVTTPAVPVPCTWVAGEVGSKARLVDTVPRAAVASRE